MRYDTVRLIQEAIDYIEEHLDEELRLNLVADKVHYSKYYLHRQFTWATGLTFHDYIHRRRLTEAARRLVCSDRSIMEIGADAGYESRQAFTAAFGAMYKQPPAKYRSSGAFYPLQFPFVLSREMTDGELAELKICPAKEQDIPIWMNLLRLTVDGYPCLSEGAYVQELRKYIQSGQALILKTEDTALGAMAFSKDRGHIEFLGVHPQYRRTGLAGKFIDRLAEEVFPGKEISITTYRERDRADTGYRKELKSFGFTEGELLVEFGYPTQRLTLSPKDWNRS